MSNKTKDEKEKELKKKEEILNVKKISDSKIKLKD